MLTTRSDLKVRIRLLERDVSYLEQTKQSWIRKHSELQDELRKYKLRFDLELHKAKEELVERVVDAEQKTKHKEIEILILEEQNEKLKDKICKLETELALHRFSDKEGLQ
jgi:hypothetical protein